MNETTQLNTELLSADARGRKHIPVAVFAVILIHVVLFVVLLIAAGCRSSARAKKLIQPQPEVAQQPIDPFSAAGEAAPVETAQQESASPMAQEPVAVTEPPVQLTQPVEPVAPVSRAVVQHQSQPAKPRVAKTTPKTKVITPKIYVVKSGDSLDKIARSHGLTIQAVKVANKMKTDVIHPGQKLQLMPVGSSPLQVRSEHKKGEKEV